MPVELERPKFLIDLLAEVDGFDESLFPSTYKIESGDTVVGDATLWTRKAWALMRMYDRELKQLRVEMEFDPSQGEQYRGRYMEIDHKVDTLKQILWSCVRAEFNLWTARSIGFRSDWKVISSKEDGQETFKRFLGGILGSLE
jgi:hypothetical protein